MIYYIAKTIEPGQHKILGYFESMPALEKALKENKDDLDLEGNGKIFQMEPGLNPVREFVRDI